MASETTLGSFEAVRARKWRSEQLCRVFVSTERVASVKVGGGLGGAGRSLWRHFGLLGVLIAYFVEKSAARKRELERPQLEAASLDQLLAQAPQDNLELRLEAIDKGALEKPGFLRRAYAARLTLQAGLVEHAFLIAGRPEAEKAKALLEGRLGSRLTVARDLKWLDPAAPIA